ncbi:sensor histidine kinase [Methylotenera versatilis]|nr:ATP-binding protein [Methylotenera versatilis]
MGRLFWKFFIFFFLAQLTTVIGLSFAIWLHNRHEVLQDNGVEMSPPARSLLAAASSTLQFGGVEGLKHLLQDWQRQPMPKVLAVRENGQELMLRPYTKASLDMANKLAQDAKFQAFAKNIKLSNGQSYLLFVQDNGRRDEFGHHHGQLPEHMLKNGISSPRPPPRFPLMPLFGGSLVSLIFAAILAAYFSKPISSLRAAFKQASNGKLDVRVAHAMGKRRDELSDLGHDFDAMASRLESLLQAQTRLLHHVSHEMRSPLARMQMALGLMKQDPTSDFLDRIELEANRIDGLVGELLELSKLESGVIQIKKEQLELSPLLNSIIVDAQFEAKSKRINLHLMVDQDYVLEGQPDLLYRAIENVVRNAIKYGPESSEISIATTHSALEKNLCITVTDQGIGVKETELEDIFKPFIRGISGSQTIGNGLGLAITKQVIEAHGGSVAAKNLKPTGFSIQIMLPY